MTETMMGTHPQDPNSEWSLFDFGSLDPINQLPDADFNSTCPLPDFSQSVYGGFSKDIGGVLDRNSAHHSPSGSCQSNEVNGMSAPFAMSQPQMSHDQLTALGDSFVAAPRPKNDSKKGLAGKIRTEASHVNNWVQNRRQRVKPQKGHGKQNADVTSTNPPLNGLAHPNPMLTSETPILDDQFSDQQAHSSQDAFAYQYSTDHYASQIHSQIAQAQSINNPIDQSSSNGYLGAFQEKADSDLTWINDLQQVSASQPFTIPEAYRHETPISLSPPSLADPQAFSTAFDDNGKVYVSPTARLQNIPSRNGVHEEPPSLNLNSNSSPTGEGPQPNPPQMPWLTAEFENRRTSDSSDLVHTVEGLHLQRSTSGIAVATTSLDPSPHLSVMSTIGISTPDTSPEQAIGKPVPAASDLASRRKRNRPPTLRPDSNRSVSFGGPMTNSPHSRNSSVSLGQSSQVRRIQSSGQLPNNNQFRVHKSSNNSMQISPRNLQAHIDKHSLHQNERRSTTDSAPNQASYAASHHPKSRPSASAASAHRSPAEYQHEFAVRKTSTTYNSSPIYQMPQANSSVPNLPTSQPQLPLSIQVPSQHNSQPQSYHVPPLSAPPHQTSFFEESPVHNGPFPPPSQQSQTFSSRDGTYNTPHHQPVTHFSPQGPGRYIPSFAPQYQFPHEVSPLAHFTGAGFLPSYPPAGHPVTPVELDIKIDIGPEPKLPSRFDNCSFQHTFADTYTQTGDKK